MLAHKELRRIQRVGRWRQNVILSYRQHGIRRSAETRTARVAQRQIYRSVALNISIVRNRNPNRFFALSGGETKRPEYRRVIRPRPSRAIGSCELDTCFTGKISEPRYQDASTSIPFGYSINRSI